ncbi:putative RNA-directed DNA polymerase from transposon BS [Trichonephila clavipes]|nr:putative RNA-directed DNA polymerase from transposon BS [Trichonephila clavipes]
MQESLNKISVWCKKWKLATSPEKSSLIHFSRKRSTIPPLLKICDKPIPEVKSLKILGIIFDPNITWKNHINYLRQKGFKYLNAIKALSSPKIGIRSDHLLHIINATIRSISDCGSQLFSFSSNSNRQKLEPIYNAALRLALGLPRNTLLDLLRAESMNGSINTRHNFLCQKFITKQIALKDWSPNASFLFKCSQLASLHKNNALRDMKLRSSYLQGKNITTSVITHQTEKEWILANENQRMAETRTEGAVEQYAARLEDAHLRAHHSSFTTSDLL